MRESAARITSATGSEVDALTAYLDELAGVLARRDTPAMTQLLRRRLASHLPRDVREELLRVVGQPPEGFRVAIEFLRYQHRMRQLAAAGEPIPRQQLELGLGRGAGKAAPVEGWWIHPERGGESPADLPRGTTGDKE